MPTVILGPAYYCLMVAVRSLHYLFPAFSLIQTSF